MKLFSFRIKINLNTYSRKIRGVKDVKPEITKLYEEFMDQKESE